MGLADIADGLSVTTQQRDRGVASVDRTDGSLADRLRELDGDLPCDASTAAAVAEAYASGGSVGAAADEAALPPTTAAKTLHRLGFEGLTPFSPLQRDILEDWLAAECTRADALELTGASEREFALATYVATHDPIPGGAAAVESALSDPSDAMVAKRDALAATMPDPESG
jgi:hypothetical protein